MSNPFVEVDIIRQPSPFAPHEIRTRTKSFVRLEGSVAELRKALVEGQVIKPGDKFYTSEGALSQHSEGHTKWTEVLRGVLVVTGDEAPMNEPSTVPSVTAYHHSHDSTLRIPTVVDHHVAHQTGNLVAGDTIHHPQPLAKPAERTPELVLSSAVSDTSDVGTTPATPNYHTTCACPACQASAAPVVVEQPDTVILPVPKDFVVCELPVLKVTEIEPSATVTQISAVEQLQVESVATDVTDGCHETIVLDEQVSATSTLCPCEACQSREAAVERVIAVEEKPQDAQAITDSDRQNLLLSSGLGSGVDISDIARPNKTSLPVVARVDVYSVQFVELDAEVDDVFVTSSPRAAGYAQERWSESTLDIEHPWVSDDGDVTKTAESEWASAVQVTGRHVISKYEVTLDTAIKPHPQFESAIQVALEIENAAKRSIELGKVFREYGHFYIAAVELGGMKHATYRKTLSDNVRPPSFAQGRSCVMTHSVAHRKQQKVLLKI
ncbi:hypothetical protein BDW22DRAFT_858661 [Trametopsis cervina]|nr:hypothetical protein BDW22DRAFT_858661 [Trametopsis cervina]